MFIGLNTSVKVQKVTEEIPEPGTSGEHWGKKAFFERPDCNVQLVVASLTKNPLVKNKGITFEFAHTRTSSSRIKSFIVYANTANTVQSTINTYNYYIYIYTVSYMYIIRLSRSLYEICVVFCVTQNFILRFSYY